MFLMYLLSDFLLFFVISLFLGIACCPGNFETCSDCMIEETRLIFQCGRGILICLKTFFFVNFVFIYLAFMSHFRPSFHGHI